MTEELLDGTDVIAALEEVRGKGMSEGMAGRGFGDSRLSHGLADRPLENGLVEMVARPVARFRVDVGPRGREDSLPTQLNGRSRIFDAEGVWELDVSSAVVEIPSVLSFDAPKLFCQGSHERDRDKGHTILPSFTVANHELLAADVHILYPQTSTFQDAEPCAIEQRRHKPWGSVQLVE